jgi:2-amino-4-hydroxy-6-hydroxymethyldihydropteridine diphosphokinase
MFGASKPLETTTNDEGGLIPIEIEKRLAIADVSKKSARSVIALGSNMGDPQVILVAALETLAQTPGIILEAKSSLYQTKAIGPPQPDYLNGCAILRVAMLPQALLATLLTIENKFGRVRHEHWGARTLDLDLLLYDDLILNEPNLQIPHPRMHKRAFVLVPLAEIAPTWIEPVSEQTIQNLLAEVDRSDVHLVKVNN